ncbi:delta-sarcoglycan [Trichonephila clavata]|uniref:Delta-sarcoglycan n=1 Tax=Trichonephila clavata TaxID=2740835 RepID=A0A8X6HFQ9_TRICU|nr:delta-sarcoglycan [Trichonephila clavata]
MNQIIFPSENGDKNSNRTCGTRKFLQWGIKSIRPDSTDCSVSSRWHHWMEKENLYLLLILLVSVVIINLTLILWIIKILDLTSEGPGKMRISEKGLRLDSDAEFLDTLSGKQIWALPSQSLKIESAGNVTMKARNSRGFVTNTLSIGEAGLQAVGNYFLIRGTTGNVLLQVDPHEMTVVASISLIEPDGFLLMPKEMFKCVYSGGLRLDGSLETPLVRGGATKDLRGKSEIKIDKKQKSPSKSLRNTGLYWSVSDSNNNNNGR